MKKPTENGNWKVLKTKTKNGRTTLSSKCALQSNKKSKFMNEQEAKEILSTLGLKTPFNKIPLLGDILF